MAPSSPPPGFNVQVDSNYHYVPTAWISMFFIVLFGLTTISHLIEALYFRLWFLLPTVVLAGIGECIGWAGRYWSSKNFGILDTPFLMQITTTIIAPTPFLAAYFIILGRLVAILGPQYGRLTPRRFAVIFCTADIVCLVVQAIGGGTASGNSNSQAKLGANIMLAGIAIQFFFLCCFIVLAAEFFARFMLDRPFERKHKQKRGNRRHPSNRVMEYEMGTANSPGSAEELKLGPWERLSAQMRWFIVGMTFSLFCLFVRAIYRLIELSDGWNGVVISTQWYFNVFDGTMVVLAMITLNVLHPGFLLTF